MAMRKRKIGGVMIKPLKFCLLSTPFVLLSLASPVAWASTIDASCHSTSTAMDSTSACPDSSALTTPNSLSATAPFGKDFTVTEYCYPLTAMPSGTVSHIFGDALSRESPYYVFCSDGGVRDFGDQHSERTYTCRNSGSPSNQKVTVRSITCKIQKL